MKKKQFFVISFLLISFLFFISCGSHKNNIPNAIISKMKPPFNNQGEQEKYWALEIFKNKYRKTEFAKFNSVISTKDSLFQLKGYEDVEYFEEYLVFQFGEKQSIIYFDVNIDYQLILEKGLLYPAILGLSSVKIGSIKELFFLSNSPKVKRFSFLEYCQEPYTVHCRRLSYFELTNETATKETDWPTFIEGAKLTFVKEGSVIL